MNENILSSNISDILSFPFPRELLYLYLNTLKHTTLSSLIKFKTVLSVM